MEKDLIDKFEERFDRIEKKLGIEKPEPIQEQINPLRGRPKNNEETRVNHTFTIRVDHKEKLLSYCHWEMLNQKDVFDKLLEDFFADKKIKKLPRPR